MRVRANYMEGAPMGRSKPSYMTVYKSIGGWKAVEIWWNPEGFEEPWQTGVGSYDTKEEAVAEAKSWAASEDREYKE